MMNETKTQRYLALDVLRGITIATMIMVNNPGSWKHIYAPLKHSEWHGCTPTDLVFPFFLFIVGVSMFFSFIKYNNTLNKGSLIRIGKRTLLIFLIGLFLNSFPQWMTDYSHVRILGVLQRIAIAYGIGSIIVLAVKKRYLPYLGTAILFVYWGLLYFLGGTDPFSLKDNFTIPFDSAILGENHLYRGFGQPFDPEGLFSTIPAIVTVIFGYLVGDLIKQSEPAKLPLKLVKIGVAGVVIGFLWGLTFPINKPLWTSSYVIYTGGWACITLAFLIWIIDMKDYKKWCSFFVVFGLNPLIIYALSGLWAKTLAKFFHAMGPDGKLINGPTWLYINIFQPLAGDLNGSLLYALAHIVVFWFLGWILYKKKIFIKV